MKKKELTLDLKKVTLSKLNSLDQIKGGGTVWCGSTGWVAVTVSCGYEPDSYDANTNRKWKPCERES